MIVKRRFKSREPRTSDERIEAIYEELSETPDPIEEHELPGSRWRAASNKPKSVKPETLKDYVVALLAWAKDYEGKKVREKSKDIESENVAVGFLAFFAFIGLSLNYGVDTDWVRLHDYAAIIRISGWILALIFLGVCIEKTFFFSHIWKFGSTKLVFGISFSALLIYSYGLGSAQINSIFGVDAVNLPYTRIYAMGIFAFDNFSFRVLLVGCLAAIVHAVIFCHFVWSHSRGEYPTPPLKSIGIILVAGLFVWWTYYTEKRVSHNELSLNLYKLAHVLDFNAKHACRNLPQDISVIYIGSDQRRVLVDSSGVDVGSLNDFLFGSKWNEIEVPKEFQQPPCETDLSYNKNATPQVNE